MKTEELNLLVQNIALEVVRQLSATKDKPCILVLSDRNEAVIDTVTRSVGKENDLYFLGEDMHGHTPTRFILPLLPCASMAELANGAASNTNSAAILELLLQGKLIEVLQFEFELFSQSMPAALYKTYVEHMEKLKSYGVKAFEAESPETVRCHQSLVTEADIERLAGSSVLRVSKDTLVTPAAIEMAKTFNLQIEKDS